MYSEHIHELKVSTHVHGCWYDLREVGESSAPICVWDDEWPDVGISIRMELNISFHTY